jgi:hypothetical protein
MDNLDGPPDIILSEQELHKAVAEYLDRNFPRPSEAQSYSIRLSVKAELPFSATFRAECWHCSEPALEKQVEITAES